MKDQSRDNRQKAIHHAAYALLKSKGYDGASMLSIAKAAKASNETLYKWYGDKRGLFQTMVEANTERVKKALNAPSHKGDSPLDRLESIGPTLLAMLMSDEAIALNRAAAADITGVLGTVISINGRDKVKPLIDGLIIEAINQKLLSFDAPNAATQTYLNLLIGDRQIRRVIGVLEKPTDTDIRRDAALAFAHFVKLGQSSERK